MDLLHWPGGEVWRCAKPRAQDLMHNILTLGQERQMREESVLNSKAYSEDSDLAECAPLRCDPQSISWHCG